MDDEFTEFVRRRGPALGRTAYLLTGDAGRAEDLVQSALLAVWRRRDKIDTEAWEAYTRRTMVNISTSWWRRASSTERPVETMPERPEGPAATDQANDRLGLALALRKLSARQRAAVVLRHYEDLSEVETARLLGCSVGSVKSYTHHGLARLRVLLAEPAAAPAVAPNAYSPMGDAR